MATEKQYTIFFWHGRTEGLASELAEFCDTNSMGDFIYKGTLDNFAERYGRHFMVKPQSGEWPDLICVTQYNSWGAR